MNISRIFNLKLFMRYRDIYVRKYHKIRSLYPQPNNYRGLKTK